MNRITKLGLTIMLFIFIFVLISINGLAQWDVYVIFIGLVGAGLFILPDDKKS